MSRAEIFGAIKVARGRGWTSTATDEREIGEIDSLLTRIGVPVDASPAPTEPAKKPPVKTLAGVIGVAAAALLTPLVMQWEGRENTAYKDIVGVWTICDGDTKDVKPGQVATDAECNARLERQLIAHAEPVLACTPTLKDKPHALAAAASLAYNVGTAAYCKSTVDRRFDAGDIKGGCDALLAWRFAGGKEVKGLLNRRTAERTICLKDAA